ncbi:MAG: S-adenosyl-l-methionine hydroxide adenosyltransferase family protein [Desulfopila sp.]
MSTTRIVTLLSDFGNSDEYVGVMKGVIIAHCRSALPVDICHQLPPQDIGAAAAMLAASFPFFPRQSIHLAVVDPGVGTARNILVLQTTEHWFIAPDNGLLTPVLQAGNLMHCYAVTPEKQHAAGATFHGRDIMAPLAGKLASGRTATELAREISVKQCVVLTPPAVEMGSELITGEIVGIDHFGNLRTSIAAAHIKALGSNVEVSVDGRTIGALHTTYGAVQEGALVALIDSRGTLEIAKNRGSAAAHLGCRIGDPVIVRLLSGNGTQ